MKKFKELRENYLEEKLKASDPAGKYIHDFVHSDNPKFAGKSKAKRIQMALAASYAAKGKSRNEEVEEVDEGMMDTVKTVAKKVGKALTGGSDEDQRKDLQRKMGLPQTGKKPTSEEVEQIDELKKSTLGSYIKKAANSAASMRKIGSDFENMADKSRKPSSKQAATNLADKYKSKSRSRRANIGKAVDRLTKEEIELDEVNMTAHIKRQATKLKMKAGGLKTTNTTMQPRPRPTMEGSVQDVGDTSMTIVSKGINKLNKAVSGKDPSSLVGTQTK